MVGLLISVLWALFWIALIVAVVYFIFWAIEKISGGPLPARAVQLVWVAVAIVCVIVLLSLVAGLAPPWGHFPR